MCSIFIIVYIQRLLLHLLNLLDLNLKLKPSVYQDRLGKGEGNAERKETPFFLSFSCLSAGGLGEQQRQQPHADQTEKRCELQDLSCPFP